MEQKLVPREESPVSEQCAEKGEVLWLGFSPGYFLACYYAI